MGSFRDPSIVRCEHGYERDLARQECPRCADRPIEPWVHSSLPHTRWQATDTTLGPRLKVAITVALVAPLLLMLLRLPRAAHQPVYAFLVVPIAGLAIFTAQFLPHLWEPGRTRIDRGGDDVEQSSDPSP